MNDLDLLSKVSKIPDSAREEVSEYLDSILAKYSAEPKKPLKFGMWKGMIKMSEDFDMPLDEFEDYM